MTFAPALCEDAWAAGAEEVISEIAANWAVLRTMEDYPATPERRDALEHSQRVFHQRLEAAGLTEADLLAHLQREMTEPRSTLRAVGGHSPDD